MKVLAISGSLRAASINSALLRTAARLAAPTMQISLSSAVSQLPLFNPDLEACLPSSVVRLHDQVAAADALLIASPEYAHGVSGTIKNALDWLVSFEPFVDKPVAVLNASPRAQHADTALRETLRTMSARIVESASISLPLLGAHTTEDEMAESTQIVQAIRAALDALHGAVAMGRHDASNKEVMQAGAVVLLEEVQTQELEAFLVERIYEFNAKATGCFDGKLLGASIRDEDGDLVAGCSGHTWGGCAEISHLWVGERHRGRGLGKKILLAAEAQAAQRGCRQVVLATHSFQAPGFYEHLGYVRQYAIEGRPQGHANIIFVKSLA